MRSIRARLAALLRSGARRNGAFGPQPRAHLELHRLECRDVPAILTVNTTADSFQQATLSLRDAISVVNNNSTLGFAGAQVNTTGAAGALGTNDTIVFDPLVFTTNATITLLSTALPTITRSVAIQGLGSDRIINANQFGSVLNIGAAATVSVSDITLTNGLAANGGGIFNAGNLTVDSVLILNNTATNQGGGIANTGTLTVEFTAILGNTSNAIGGGIQSSGTATVANSTVSGNTAATSGGGITNTPASSLSLVNSTVSGNSALGGSGGGIQNGGGTLTVVNSTITKNSATTTGGGIQNPGTLNLRNTIVGMNTGGNFGGTGPAVATSFNNLIDAGGSGGLANGTNGNQVGIANTGLAINVIGASWINGVATITNAVPHNLRTGQLVTLSGIIPNGYNGTVVVSGIPSPTTFSYLLGTNPGTYNNGGGVVIPNLSNNGGPTRTIALFTGTPGVDAGTSLTNLTAAAAAGPTVTTLLANAQATDTILQVANSALLVPGQLYLISNEVLQVTSINSPTSVTVLRARAGTTANFLPAGFGFTQASSLTAPATALDTAFTVSSTALLTAGMFYHVGTEIVQIVSVDNPTTVTVLRGQFGTTAGALPGATPALPGNAVLTPALTNLTVASSTFLVPGQLYRLGLSEVVLVNTVNSATSVTVVRGLLGTTIRPVISGAPIDLATDQRGYVRGTNNAVDIGAFELQPALALSGPTQSVVLTGTPFSQTITPSGGNGAITVTFAIVGTPPPGITVTQNGTAVTIDGTPTASGLLTVNVTATDEINNRVSTAYRVTVLDPAGVPSGLGPVSGTGGILPGPQVPSISAVFEPTGFVILTTDSFGALYRNGAKIADNSVRGASIAYGPRGEVVLVTSQTGLLIRYDSTSGPFGRFINTGGISIQGASLSFDANGNEVMLVTTSGGALYRFGPTFSILASSGVRGASLAFEPVFSFSNTPQKEVLLVTLTGGGAVYRSETFPNSLPAIRLLTSGGVFAASVSYGNGIEVIDGILFSGQIAQLSTPGGFSILGRIT